MIDGVTEVVGVTDCVTFGKDELGVGVIDGVLVGVDESVGVIDGVMVGVFVGVGVLVTVGVGVFDGVGDGDG